MPKMKKILIMGKQGSGKTSIRSVVFGDYSPSDTQRLGPTFEVECSHVRYRGELMCLNIWDCGGQEKFIEEYFKAKKYSVFNGVDVLVYVFDVINSDCQEDWGIFLSALEAIDELSKQARVYCFIHKMDLVPENRKCAILDNVKTEMQSRLVYSRCTVFATSIWDQSLYLPWSNIVNSLVGDMGSLRERVSSFRNILEADEVILFDRVTLLLVCGDLSKFCVTNQDSGERYENMVKVLKKFKRKCAKLGIDFEDIEVKNSAFFAVVEKLTPDFLIMVMCRDISMTAQGMRLNIRNARKHFEGVEKHQQQISRRDEAWS